MIRVKAQGQLGYNLRCTMLQYVDRSSPSTKVRSWQRAAAALPRRKVLIGTAVVVLGAMAVGYAVWTRQTANAVPQGFVMANGRLEAQEIDVAAKYGGRLVEVTIQEGDNLAAGAVIARLDSDELNAAIVHAEAQLEAARQDQQAAAHSVTERESQLTFTSQELERTKFLSERGYATGELLDKRRTDWQAAEAAHNFAISQLRRSEHAVKGADAEIRRLQAQLDQTILKAPRDARVLYRLAVPGEVLAAGGKVATLVDLADMRMTVFLASPDAGAIAIGAEARIVLDSLPNRPIPARITFVSPTAQFTPKTVETQDERTKLVFRIKANVVDPRGAPLKSGMPGVAYFRFDEHQDWPAWLK